MSETNQITEITRRNLIDAICKSGISLSGRLNNLDFLKRVNIDPIKLPSNDRRYSNALGDIVQHTVANDDWDAYWILLDDRFTFLSMSDAAVLSFLCEMLHPVVRTDMGEVSRLLMIFNNHLMRDGWEIVERGRLSGRPVFAYQQLGTSGTLHARPEIISKKTRYEFQEYLVGWTLREIERLFDSVDLVPSEVAPKTTGARRGLVEQYYNAIDFKNSADVNKLLKVYEYVLIQATESLPDAAANLQKWLKKDRFEFIDGKLVAMGHLVAIPEIRSLAEKYDSHALSQQITRIQTAIESDPGLAIGSSKEMIETCCKTILSERTAQYEDGWDLPKLVRETLKVLHLLPEDISSEKKGADVIKKILGSLATLSFGLAELRNDYGTGHGRDSKAKGLGVRHAKLAVGAASTLCIFLFDTHEKISR